MAGAKGRTPRRDTTRTTKAGDAANPKRTESERISEDIADFERGGGKVEVLGTTRVLQKVDAPPGLITQTPPKPAKRSR
ncbi:MAG: hypothetical protein M3Q40_01315 [Pseudomonadota bacterium]|nr:hypothetical protein [Pseudomonadota bacterium]